MTITFVAGFFSVAPIIIANSEDVSRHAESNGSPTTTSVTIITRTTTSDANADVNFTVIAQRQASDYKNPNAYAVVPSVQVAYLKDVKSSGTAGGTFTSGAWQTRVLNTTEGSSFVSLSSNQFTLPAGQYDIEFNAPAFACDRHKSKLYNITDASDVIFGSSAFSESTATDRATTESIGKGSISLTGTKTFEIRHRSSATATTQGFGVESSFGVSEIYTVVKITKLR